MMQGFLGVQLFCPPPGGISLDQAMRIFLKWANDHPECPSGDFMSRMNRLSGGPS